MSEIEELRYRRATEATAWLIDKLGWNFFSAHRPLPSAGHHRQAAARLGLLEKD